MPELLSVVERGWQGARECSLVLARQGIRVTHLVKGRLPPGVRALIQPVDGIALAAAPAWRFWGLIWGRLASGALSRRLRWVVCDRERTLSAIAPWCRRAGVTPALIRELPDGAELSVDGRVLTLSELVSGEKPGDASSRSA